MKKIVGSLRQHRELILNYFRAQKLISSGVVEGLNNRAKVTYEIRQDQLGTLGTLGTELKGKDLRAADTWNRRRTLGTNT